MKACKIEIKQTWVELEYPIYREAVRDKIEAHFMEEGKMPDVGTFTVKELTYYPVKVYEVGKFETTTYLVKQDEQKIFRDLMTVQSETVNDAIREAVDKKWQLLYYEIRGKAHQEIKKISWYKRLFNKF